MKKLCVALILVLGVVTAYAGSYTLTTTGAEDTAIARLRAFANTANLFGAPHATDLAFVNAMCRAGILNVRDAARAANPTYETALAAATSTQKDAICSTLSLPAGCLP